MTDPLPADVREYLEARKVGAGPIIKPGPTAGELLAKYPQPQPEPAWRVGDVAVWGNRASIYDTECDWYSDSGRDAELAPSDAELIFRDGRRVHPPRFHDHADMLRVCARGEGDSEWRDRLRRIADDIDPEVTDA